MVRAITAVILGVLGFAAIWFLPASLLDIFVIGISALGLHEYGRMFFKDRFERWIVIFVGIAVAAVMLFNQTDTDILVFSVVAAVFFLCCSFMWRTSDMQGVADRIGIATLGVIYLGIAFPFWGWIRGFSMGREFVLLTIVPACLCDSFAYIFGKTIGKIKFAPMVSPNKTIEGFVGALIGSMLGVSIVKLIFLPYVSWFMVVVFAVMVWIISPIGDLIESMFKRSRDIKDSGNLIPGHGGVLDRVDALIFTAPAAYMFIKFFVVQ